MLAYLAIESQRELTRRQLASLLWSDDPEERALHNLRQTLSSLRKTLSKVSKSVEIILPDRNTISLNHRLEIWVDCIAFKAQMQHALSSYQIMQKTGSSTC